VHRQLLLGFAVVLLLGAQAADKDEDKMQGTWTFVSAEKGGEKAPEDEIKKLKVTIKGNELIIGDGKRDEKATFKLDSSKKPKALDVTPPRDDKPVLGIYELDGDNLKMCWRKGGGERPTKFASEPKSDLMLLVLKREKKKE
jgi:uncharacterized protein (TIGR03067 family)